MDPVINSVLQSPLARNLNHIATDSTQFTYHVEQNAPPLSLKKGYIDSAQSFVGFDNTYTFTLPQWGYLAKNILRLQYEIKPLQRTHVTPVLPMYHMIDKVELMSHNNVIETLYGDSILIKHAYYTETCCAATKMMGTLNVPPECGSYVDISSLFRDSASGAPFNPFDHTQWNNTTNKRVVTLFLELPFSFTDNPAMYFDTRFVEYLTVQVKLSSTKHGVPLFQAACAVEVDMGDDNVQLDRTRHKNDITTVTTASLTSNMSTYYEDKVAADQNTSGGNPGKSGAVAGCKKFYYRPFFTRAAGTGGSGNVPFIDGSATTSGVGADQTGSNNDAVSASVHARKYLDPASTENCVTRGMEGKGLDPFELQLGGRPGSRLPSKMPLWMDGFYPSADKNGIYACAHAGEPRFLRIGSCNFSASDYTVGYWGFLAAGKEISSDFGENPAGLGMTTLTVTPHADYATSQETGVSGNGTGNYSDANVCNTAALWAQLGGRFVYSKLEIYGTAMALNASANGELTANGIETGIMNGGAVVAVGDAHTHSSRKFYVNIDTKAALIERFYAMYPYLNLSNQPSGSSNHWEGFGGNDSYGHGHMATDSLVVEGSQNNASFEGLPQSSSVNLKLLVTYLSLHDRVREQVSMDNFKDNMPATILMHDTFQEYNGLIYGSSDSPWATSTDQTMVVPIRSKNLAYAISIVAYRNRTNAQLCGGGVYNTMYDGNGPERSKMDVSMTQGDQLTPDDGASPFTDVTLLSGKVARIEQIENHTDGERSLIQRKSVRREGTTDKVYQLSGSTSATTSTTDTLTRWNGTKARLGQTVGGTAGSAATEVIESGDSEIVRSSDGVDIGTKQSKGPCLLSDPSFVWPNYKVVENFKTVKPTHAKLSIAGQTVYETAQQTALANSYYSTTSDAYTPVKGGGQWFVEKDLDNLPYHYNKGAASRGDMGSVARLPNIVGASVMGGQIQEHCDAHVITFGLNKTDQLSNNGALGLSSATNAQLELKFAEPCRVSVYVHYHATLQIDSNTGVMSRSLDV